jgi:hypothetical protein
LRGEFASLHFRCPKAATPTPLFALRQGNSLAAVPDGQRFVIAAALDNAVTPPITVIMNWAGRR